MSPLEPALTGYDRMILAAVPSARDDRRTLWQIGETLDLLDMHDLYTVLNGLEDFGYIDCDKDPSLLRKPGCSRWWRTPKGDAAL